MRKWAKFKTYQGVIKDLLVAAPEYGRRYQNIATIHLMNILLENRIKNRQ